MKIDTKDIGKNIFAGFVVSLIALPLALGLALASGVPPVAGIISAIVGGIVVAVMGGSHVTIVGPGNGMVVATLTPVMILGAGDAYAGYLYTLAAVVCSGVLIFLMGLFRFGGLSDFFPSAAIRGLLAGIGLIIMAKQLHVMLGVMNPEAVGPAALIAEMPKTLAMMFNGQLPVLAYTIGLVSLAIMALYPRIRNRIFHFIPAPMWIVIIGIAITYFADSMAGFVTPLPADFLITIPDNMLAELRFPDFGKFFVSDFWLAVITLTLIASIESLLSIKAVDKLDPLKRRSNVNRDLRALGLGTAFAGLAGGVNVVTVIARSSVNVNNGATNRWSNLFHGMFLLIFMLVFTDAIQHIPLPALAAILVFTGYKLAEPAVFISVARVGWEQLAIFLLTMLGTIFTGLIAGIVIGIAATLLFQLRVLGRMNLIARYAFRPNTLLYKESNGHYHLSVKAYSNFINFLGLKKKLDSIPPQSQVIVDFSLAKYVDHSVLEQLQDYYYSFRNAGGDLELIGLDDLGSASSHPLAPRLPKGQVRKSRTILSHRQKGLRLFSKKLEWVYKPGEFAFPREFNSFKFFATRIVDKGRNRVDGQVGDIRIILADLDYHEGEFIARETRHSTMMILKLPTGIPSFVMDKENLLDRVAYLAGFSDINFSKHPDFSQTFKVKGTDKKEIHRFFDDEHIDFFQSNKAFHVESNGEALLIFEKERVAILTEIKQLVSFASRLAAILNQKLKD